MGATDPLSETEKAVLEFEQRWWQRPGGSTKADAIRAELDVSPSRYYAVLGGLLDRRAALAHDPLLIHRLRRRRSDLRRARVLGEVPRRSERR